MTVSAIIIKGDFRLLDNEPDDLWVFNLTITYYIRVEVKKQETVNVLFTVVNSAFLEYR